MNIPHDWQDPKWDEYDRVHNWRNYASEELQLIWQSFTDKQKQVIASCFNDAADTEVWD